jgi:long-chain fatty acid transport protein
MKFGSAVAVAATLVPVIAGAEGSASAAGFSAARFGGEHGNVTTTNPTALYYNPAGIAFSDSPTGWTFFGDATVALRQASWEHAPAPTDMPEPAGAEGATFGKATLSNRLPSGPYPGPALGASLRLGSLAFGLGLMAPFAGEAKWDQNLKFKNDPNFPLAAGGIQRWSGTTGALTFLYVTGGIAYRRGRVAVGVTGNLIISSLASTQSKTPIGSGEPDVTREGTAVLEVKGIHGSFGAGIMVEAIDDRLWFGAGYQAQPQLGPMTLNGTIRTTYAGGSTLFNVDFHQALPDSLRLGGRFRANQRLEFRLSGELTRWSVMQSQCVGFEHELCQVDTTGADATPKSTTIQNLRRRWKDTYGVRAGASVWVRPTVEIFAGTGFETAAVPDATMNPGLADANHVDGALGGKFKLSDRMYLAASFTLVQFLDRDNTGKSELANYKVPTNVPDGGGKYTQRIEIFNTNLEYKF